MMVPIAKKRRLAVVEDISFDEAAREQYLTGFHKRKQQRIKQAKEAAIQREREERIKERKHVRLEATVFTKPILIEQCFRCAKKGKGS